ncbi:MAG: dihydroorotate dehydrogenase electron transfer subunit [Termitinemataceae bacterium]|nr:MAG: dihydroorotate dehydrogenase electron transfer subunit [Termitinemataceae bacterium]
MTIVKSKKSLTCSLLQKTKIAEGIFMLEFDWNADAPAAGQFFLIKPQRTSVFLARPISVASYKVLDGSGRVQFFVAEKGIGTKELCAMNVGECAFLTGPLGNTFKNKIAQKNTAKKIALVSGGVGIAPLYFFADELTNLKIDYDFYSGFRHLQNDEFSKMKNLVFCAQKKIIVTDDGSAGEKGLVTDFIQTQDYDLIFCCGPKIMMHALQQKCANTNTELYISMEERMACGTGACLGCTVNTTTSIGKAHCCTDGPVFNAKEINFD